jgi:RimJ/RimL family protein N-acetyltransferase
LKLERITVGQATELLDDELMGRISEKGEGVLDSSHTYLGIFIDGQPIGFWVAHYTSSSTLHIHININSQYRDYAMGAGRFFLEYIHAEYPRIERIECEVPLCYPDVVKFIQKFNFKSEGVKRQSVYRDGALQDVQMLSLLRSEYNGRD